MAPLPFLAEMGRLDLKVFAVRLVSLELKDHRVTLEKCSTERHLGLKERTVKSGREENLELVALTDDPD